MVNDNGSRKPLARVLSGGRPVSARALRIRGLVTAAALTSCLLIAACGGDDGDSKGGSQDKGAVAMSFGDTSFALWSDVLELMKPQVEAAGYKLLVDDPKFKVDKQAQDWDAWIAQGDVKAIMGFPVQVDALIPVTQRANAADVAVLGYTQNWKGTKAALITDPIADGEKLGQAAGEWIKKRYGDKAVEVCVLTDRSTDITKGRSDGMIRALKEVAPASVIHDVPAFSRQQGFDAAKRTLVAHPKTRVWLFFGDEALAGAYRAVSDSGVAKDDPDYFFGGLDLTNETLDIMAVPNSIWRVGYVFTSTELAKANTQLLVDAANGKPVHNYLIKPKRVTPENIEQFYVGDRKKP
jgi:ribose transport system substrate-binding protein